MATDAVPALQSPWRIHRHTTAAGELAVYTTDVPQSDERPLLLVVHGALRRAEVLMGAVPWWPAPFDIVFVDLPGHGRSSPLVPATVDRFAQRLGVAMAALFPQRRLFVLGESLGGLVALAMAGLQETDRVHGVIAADPPLTTAKLWHVAHAVRTALARAPHSAFMQSFAADIFGIATTQGTAERIYYPVLDRLRVPALILTGDIPLLPPRQTTSVPCVMDEVDRFVIERLYRGQVTVKTLHRSGHLVLFDAVSDCRQLIEDFVMA